VIDSVFTDAPIGKGVQYLKASGDTGGLPTGEQDWQVYQGNHIHLGTTNATYWFRFVLINQTSDEQKLLIEADYPLLDLVHMNQLENGVLINSVKTGDISPFELLPIAHHQLLMPLTLASQQRSTIYIKVTNDGVFNLPLHVWQLPSYIEENSQETLLSGLLFGFLVSMIFSSLLLFLVSRSRSFLLFALSLIAQTLGLSTWFGYGNRFIWPDWVWLHQHILVLLMMASMILSALFGAALLNIRELNIRLLQLNRGLVAVGGLVMLISLFVAVYISAALMLIYSLILSLSMLGIGVWCWRNQMDMAVRLYTFAWSITSICFLYVVVISGLKLPMVVSSLSVFVVNSIAVSILLFVALTKQYLDRKSARMVQQQQAIAQIKSQEAMQQELLKVEEQSRQELEVRIQERTFELEVTLRELEESNRELEEKNTQDALTGIRNRRFFDKKYLAEFRRSRREQTQLSLLMMDIDHFKQVNDNHGHLAGDDVIRFVGRTLQDALKRPSDDACRYGGEEFALILPSTGVEGAIKLAEAIREKLAKATIDTQSGELNITLSCGIFTAIAELGMTQNYYIELADKALYAAKQSGRNKVIHFENIAEHSESVDE
jgi:diguanylate cyclase (GGDEF)-like protein